MQSNAFEELKAKYPMVLSPKASMTCGEGWISIIDRFLQEISAISPGTVTVNGFYEKYGSLRIDYEANGISREDDLLFDKAEIVADSRSYRFCEICGDPGHLRATGPVPSIFVACEAHARGSKRLPPDESDVTLRGIRYRYDEFADGLVEIA